MICPRAQDGPRFHVIDGVRIHTYKPPPETSGVLSFGYEFVYCELSGTNAFFVRNDLICLLGNLQPVMRSFNHHLLGGAGVTPPTNRQWDVV